MMREIVLPGTFLGNFNKKKAGKGTFIENDKIYSSRLGIVEEKGDYINVIPLSGIYEPNVGDSVIGIVQEALRNAWIVDINAPYPSLLGVEESPWKINYGETAKYLKAGEMIIATIARIDEARNIELTMKGKPCRKIENGIVIDIQPTKVPRVIGKNGSMLSLIKKYTGCWIFVGQNGRIWLKCSEDKLAIAIEAIRKIEEEAHTIGLTQRIEKMLRDKNG